MTVRFLEAARSDLRGAVRYYNAQHAGLGSEFRDEVKATIERICRYPHGWQMFYDHARRCRTKRFPYGVIYQIRDREILIVAIAHLHRSPEAWRDRL